jgi:aldehyde dehydrogenase (NAD+)
MNQSQIIKISNSQKRHFRSGVTLGYSYRIEQLKKLYSAVKEFTPEILSALQNDLGKSNFEGYATEVGLILDEIRNAKKNLKKWMKPKRVKTDLVNFGAKSYIYHEPFGVSLIISPWNYPFQLAISPLIGALAAGNCAVIKPSRFAERTLKVIKKMFEKYFDNKIVFVIEADSETKKFLLSQKWDFVFFTGSTNVGKIVMSECAKKLTPNVLELGGKSPTIVHKDAKIEQAAKKICWGKFLNSGQTCVAPDYILVHNDIKESLVESVKKYIIEFFGSKPNKSIDYPKIINKKHFNQLKSLLNKGNIIFGGEIDEKKNKISPTLIDNVTLNDPIMREEIFGPILPILTYENIEKAIEIILQNPNPLALYLFTNDKNIEKTIIERVRFGGGCINETVMHFINSDLPFGGIGSSGIGKYHGESSFKAFSNQKSILKANQFINNPLRYPPYKNKIKLVKIFLR